MPAPAAPYRLDALGPGGAFRARRRTTIREVSGAPIADLGLVPTLYVTRSMSALRHAPVLAPDVRSAALAEAGRIFLEESVEGIGFEEYAGATSLISGVPVSVVRSAAAEIADSARKAHFAALQARPWSSVSDWRDPLTRTGRAVWTPRGKVFAVHAAGNHPGPHALWLEALALGYHVAVRPSRREPLTPHRLVSALRRAGFGDERVMLLPTDHDGADELLRCADLGIVYGGDDVVRKYASDTTVLPQGPGRSKILITADQNWSDHLDTIIDSVAHHAGVACINTTAVLVEGDVGPVAEALAERLGALPSMPPDDDGAVLPVQPVETARDLERYLATQAKDAKAWIGGDGIVDRLPGGGAVLRPAVLQLDQPDRRIGVELPFPCVWVAPWSRDAGIAPLRNSLVVTAITCDDGLFDDLVTEPTISNVYRGDHPTHWMEPGVPHDGHLGEFLMRTKTVIRD